MYVGIEIEHATAVFCELTLAMGIGSVTKILTPLVHNDQMTRETTRQRIRDDEGRFVAFIFKIACKLSDGGRKFPSMIPWLSMILALLSLMGGAICPDRQPIFEWVLFFLSFAAFVFVVIYVFYNREIFSRSGEQPTIEPAE